MVHIFFNLQIWAAIITEEMELEDKLLKEVQGNVIDARLVIMVDALSVERWLSDQVIHMNKANWNITIKKQT